MKWLLFFQVFLVLITACGIVKASQDTMGFEFAQGVIVDGVGSAVYIMSPEGGIDAVDLSDGTVIKKSTRGAKPLLLHDDRLLAQVEGKDGNDVLSLVSLNTKDLTPVFSVDIPLPSDVRASVADRLGHSFYTIASIDGNVITVKWRSLRRPISAVPTREAAHVTAGFARIDPLNGRLIASGEGEPPASGMPRNDIPDAIKNLKGSGVLASPLCPVNHLVAAIQYTQDRGRTYVTLHRWNKTTAEPLPDIVLFGNELTFRNFSRDCQYVLASRHDNGWHWNVYSVITGKIVTEIRNSLPGAEFFVMGNRLIYEMPAVGGLTSGQITIVQPRRLLAMDLATGKQLWTSPIRETTYRGPFPGSQPSQMPGYVGTVQK